MSKKRNKVSFKNCNNDALNKMKELRPHGKNTKNQFHKRFKNYKSYLQSSEWTKVKKIFLDKYRNKVKKCIGCNSKKNIHVHHRSYNRLGTTKEYLDLVTVCAECHLKIHEVEKNQNIKVHQATRIVLGTKKSCNKKQRNASRLKPKKKIKKSKFKKDLDREKRKVTNSKKSRMIFELRIKGINTNFNSLKMSTIEKIYNKYIK